MANLSEKYKKLGKIVIADFVCPLPETRKLFNPDYLIWVDTIKKEDLKTLTRYLYLL